MDDRKAKRQQKLQELRAQQEQTHEQIKSNISGLREALEAVIKVDEGEALDDLPFDAQKLVKYVRFAELDIRKCFSLQDDIVDLEREEYELETLQPLIEALEELKEDARAQSMLSGLDLFNDEPEQE